MKMSLTGAAILKHWVTRGEFVLKPISEMRRSGQATGQRSLTKYR
jgi:hypothetical protein